jgi:hypothetical protein
MKQEFSVRIFPVYGGRGMVGDTMAYARVYLANGIVLGCIPIVGDISGGHKVAWPDRGDDCTPYFFVPLEMREDMATAIFKEYYNI